jgi:hypothetical protein
VACGLTKSTLGAVAAGAGRQQEIQASSTAMAEVRGSSGIGEPSVAVVAGIGCGAQRSGEVGGVLQG